MSGGNGTKWEARRSRRSSGPILPMAPAKARLLELWTARFGIGFGLLTLAYFAAAFLRSAP